MTFIISENCLTCLYRNKSPSYVSTLRSVLSWFALANRLPIPQKIGLSKGAWQENHFRLRPLEEIMWPRQACWVKIFKTAVIASMQESIPPDPFLHTTFLLARQITAVQTPLHVDAGIMWHGSFCSLVPVQVLANSAILWHFEASDNDDVLQLKDIGALQGPWFQTMDLGVHYSAPAVIGWCPAGLIRLATDQSLVSRNIWASGVRTEMYSVTYQVQLSCQPVPQFGITGLLAFQRDDPQCRQVETANYLKLIDSSQKRFVILYDVTSKRGWLLPEVVALHHLVLHAQRWLSYSQSPLAAPSVDGRDSSFILRKHANHILTQNGNVRYRLKNLVTDIASNLRRIEPIPSPHNLIGFQMMDIANGDPHKLHPMTVNMRPRPSWMAFTQHLPCLLASNLGDAITGNRSQMANAGCNFLKAGRNYLAATVSSLKLVSIRAGGNVSRESWEMPGRKFWNTSKCNFRTCSHQGGGNCWEQVEFLQDIDTNPRTHPSGAVEVPDGGVVVFGSRDRGAIDRILDRLHI